MAWQGAVASMAQIAAKAVLKPVERNLALKAVRCADGHPRLPSAVI
jgi:hypothetical protein